MASFSGYLLDLMYLRQGIDKSRFLLNFEVDDAGKGQLGRWRQNPKNNRMFWKTVGGNYEVIPDGLVTRDMFKYDIHFRDNSKQNKTSLKLDDAILGSYEFPHINQNGLGYLYETPEFGPIISANPVRRDQNPNVFWAITKKQQSVIDDANMWIGGGMKFSVEAGVKSDAVHGYIVNVKNPSQKRYFQLLTNGISFGVGAQIGVVVIMVNAANPSSLLNTESVGWDWSFCLGGAFSKFLKPLTNFDEACKFGKIGQIASKIFYSKGVLGNDELMSVTGHIKSAFSSSALESSPSYCVIDTPAAGGLALGISRANSVVTRI